MYTNPIIPGLNPDPSICRNGQDYYLATSTMYLYPGIPIYHSRDLVQWQLIGHVLTRPEHFQPGKTDGCPMIFAPTLRFHQGTFYLITTNVHGGGNFYVTATDPAGEWSSPVYVDQEMFDPSLLFDDDGKVYYTRRGPSASLGIVQAEIDIKTGKLTSELRPIGVGMVSDDAEAPHLYHIGDWYYLLLAEGGSRFLHMGTIGRSRSPWGPFERCPHNPIIAQHHAWWHGVKSIGHGDLIQAHDESWWIVFLGTRHCSYDALTVIGRETFLAPVSWNDGWPIVDAVAQRQLEVNSRTWASEKVQPSPPRDDFETFQLDKRWTMLSPESSETISTNERPGFARLTGTKWLLTEGSKSAFMGWRQEHFDFVAETLLDFTPNSDAEEAGLVVFHRHDYYYAISVARRAGKLSAVLRKRVGDMITESAPIPINELPVRLQLRGNPDRYEFNVASRDGTMNLGSGITQLLTSEVVGTWSGMLIGIFACSHESDSPALADFDYFEMVGRDAETAHSK